MRSPRFISAVICLAGATAFAVERPTVPPDLLPLAQDAKEQFTSGNFAGAEALYRQILEKPPRNLYALSNLGVVLFRSGQSKEARRDVAEGHRRRTHR